MDTASFVPQRAPGGPAERAAPEVFPMARQQLGERLNARIGTAGSVFVEHPSERRLLACLDRTDLEAFAQAHQLNVVRRVGGRVFEFTRRRPGPNA